MDVFLFKRCLKPPCTDDYDATGKCCHEFSTTQVAVEDGVADVCRLGTGDCYQRYKVGSFFLITNGGSKYVFV